MLWNDQSSAVQTNASMAMKMFTQAPPNRIKFVGYGAVPPLFHVLANGIDMNARINAASAIRDPAEQKKNRMFMGELGAVPALLERFCGCILSPIARRDVVSVLHCLTHECSDNLSIRESMRIIPQLLEIVKHKSSRDAIELRRYAVKIVSNLAGRIQGTEDLLGVGGVELMLKIPKNGEAIDGYCLEVLHKICTTSPARFATEAEAAGAKA